MTSLHLELYQLNEENVMHTMKIKHVLIIIGR